MVDLVNTTNGITRLNSYNYQNWRSCIKSYLEGQDLWEVINGGDTKQPTNFYKLIKWKVKAGKVMYVLKSTIEDELLLQVKDDDTPKMAWDTFASLFSNTNDAQQFQYDPMMNPKLYKAAKEGDMSIFDGLHHEFRMYEEANQYGIVFRTLHGKNNILHIAARAGRDKFAAKALEYFPFLADQENSQRDTPVLVAARFGHLEVVEKLIRSATENETNSSSRRLPRGALVERDHHQSEQVTRQVGMAPAAENDTNPSSSHPQSAAEEDRIDLSLEEGNIPAGMVAVMEINQTNSSSSRQRDVGEAQVDHQSGALAENDTNPSSSHPQAQSAAEEDSRIDLSSLEEGNIPAGMVAVMEINQTNSRSSRQRDVGEGQVDHHWRVANSEGTEFTTALHEALRNKHQDVARYLLGLNPAMAAFDNLAGESPLFLAAESGCELFMSDILKSDERYSTNGPKGQNALHAARYCCGNTIYELIDQNPDLLRQMNYDQKAAIHYAVDADYEVLLDVMLKKDPSLALFPDGDGYTPLLTASSRGCWKMCKNILEICPESIEACNHKGQNALHLCKSWNYGQREKFVEMPAIRELLNVGDYEGNTPLHLAILQHDYDKAMFLVSLDGIDLGAVNKKGFTALDLCDSDTGNLLQKLSRFHLLRHRAPRGRHPNVHKVLNARPKEFVRGSDADLKSIVKTINLVAILIVTITFTAAFTMPGGYNNSNPDLGLATLVKKTTLKGFIISDTVAMCSSTTVVFLLIWAASAEGDLLLSLVNASWLLLCISLVATLVAFMFGICAVTYPKSKWVEIVVFVICSLTPFLITPRTVVDYMFANSWFLPITLTRDIPSEIWYRLKRIGRHIIKKIKLRRNHGQRNEKPEKIAVTGDIEQGMPA